MEVSIKLHYSDIFKNNNLFSNHKHLSAYEISKREIFTCCCLNFGLICKNSIFFCPHSRISHGNQTTNCQVILLKCSSIKDAHNCITTFYARITQHTATFQCCIFYVNMNFLDEILFSTRFSTTCSTIFSIIFENIQYCYVSAFLNNY